jgi:rRNA-processing protein FCF1
MDTSFLIQLSEPGGMAAIERIEELLGGGRPRLRLLIPSCVVDELRSLSRRLPGAALAVEFMRGGRPGIEVEVVERRGRPDDAVLELALESRGVLATMDGGLLRRARGMGVPTLTLHGGMPVLTGDPAWRGPPKDTRAIPPRGGGSPRA